MERIVWVVDNNKADLLQAQRSINSTGGMKASVFFSFDALEKQIEVLVSKRAVNSIPSIVLVDYTMVEMDNFTVLDSILQKNATRLNSIPVLFMISERSETVEENCFSRGAVALIEKPLSKTSISRIEQLVWRFHMASKAAVKIEQQSMELRYAREIKELNEQLNRRNELLYKTFGMYFNDEVLSEILNGSSVAAIGGRKCQATILMADLRGFTALSQDMPSESLMDMLNVYFSAMTDVIMSYRGTVIEFLGDGILAVFGVPIREDCHAELAVAAAIDMQNKMREIRKFCLEKKYSLPEMGIGLHSGEIFIGNIGSERAMRYNIIGSTVNQTARIESYSVGGQVLASEDVLKKISCECITEYFFKVKGKGMENTLQATSVKEIRGAYNCKLHYDGGRTIIFETPLKAIFHVVDDKKITGRSFEGEILTVTGKSAIVRTEQERVVRDFTDVCLDVNELQSSGSYGKVLHGREYLLELVFTRFNRDLEAYMANCFVTEEDFSIIEINDKQELESRLTEITTDYALAYIKGINEVEFYFRSRSPRIRALEFMDYLTEDFGKIRGDGQNATGIVTASIMNSNMADQDITTEAEYLAYKVESYLEDICWIDSTEYAYSHKEEINSLTRYVKRNIPWAVVSANDFLPEGTKYTIKSLENESGELHVASSKELIMIGRKGEVYCIDKEKFEKTYEYDEQMLDIFEMGFEYIPEIYQVEADEYITIDEKARLCYPKRGNAIIAKKLDKRTKVFNRIAGEDYFLGNPGDYLAIREDDYADIYIIKGDIFDETYEEK